MNNLWVRALLSVWRGGFAWRLCLHCCAHRYTDAALCAISNSSVRVWARKCASLSILLLHSAAFPKLRLGQGVHMLIPWHFQTFHDAFHTWLFSQFQDKQVLVDKASFCLLGAWHSVSCVVGMWLCFFTLLFECSVNGMLSSFLCFAKDSEPALLLIQYLNAAPWGC